MRSLWSGAISFGLVNIPVRLYSASGEDKLDFDMLHKKDLSPIRYARVCKTEEKEVPYEEIVKGHEVDGEYVVLTEEDFQKANVRKTKTVDIVEFVSADEIDVIYFEKPYFLEPDKNSSKAYALLREALKKSKKVAIARFVLRNREHLATIKPQDNVLVLDQMRFFNELRKTENLSLPKAEITEESEVNMALALIEQLTKTFQPEKFKDTYQAELKELIKEKSQGKLPKPKEAMPQPTKVPDLMNMLRASLEQQKGRPAAFH